MQALSSTTELALPQDATLSDVSNKQPLNNGHSEAAAAAVSTDLSTPSKKSATYVKSDNKRGGSKQHQTQLKPKANAQNNGNRPNLNKVFIRSSFQILLI